MSDQAILEHQVERITDAVCSEVLRAMRHHGPMHSHHEAYAVIREEFEQEYWPLVCQNPSKLTRDEQQARLAALHSELIQTAAMCVRAIWDLCEEGVPA